MRAAKRIATLTGDAGLFGLLSLDDGRELHLSDIAIDSRNRGMSGTVIYYDCSTFNIEEIMFRWLQEFGPPTEAWRTPKRPPTYRYEQFDLNLWFKPIDAWGGKERTAAGIAAMVDYCSSINMGPCTSAQALAGKIIRRFARVAPLQPETLWGRALAAIHQGHVGCYHRYAADSTLWDIKAAYLNAMRGDFPPTLLQPVECRPGEIQHEWLTDGWKGIVSGWFDVPYSFIPAMPTFLRGQSLNAYGEVHCTVTADLARVAIACGATLVRSTGGMAFQSRRTGPWLSGIASFLDSLPKHIRKPAYIVLWGAFAARGYWYSQPYDWLELSDDKFDGSDARECVAYPAVAVRMPDSRFPWEERTVNSGHDPSEIWRPDLSASIASVVACKMAETANRYGDGVLQAQVDSLVLGSSATSPGPEWDIKACGKFNGWGAGNYMVGDHCATAGRPDHIPKDVWLSGVVDTARTWHGPGAAYSSPRALKRSDYLFK